MAGTKAGAAKAKAKMMEKYGEDYYATIGKEGGKASTTGGFYGDRELAVRAGRIGGKASKRGKSTKLPKEVTNNISEIGNYEDIKEVI